MSQADQVVVLDASALLAFVQGEPGAERVEEALVAGARCSAVNWSEVAQKVGRHGNWMQARALIESYGIVVDALVLDDAERAAERWEFQPTLSLADRCCLALADRLDTVALTADRSWRKDDRARLIC